MTTTRRPRPVRPDHFRTRRVKKTTRPADWLVLITGVAGVMTIILVLLGFGVTLSAESLLIPNNALYTTPSELIALSSIAIGTFIEHAWRLEAFYEMVLEAMPFAALAAAALALGLLIVTWPGAPVIVRARRIRDSISNRIRRHFTRAGRLRAVIIALAGLVGVLAGVPLAAVANLFLVISATCLLAAVPLFGYTAGKVYIEEWVVGPKRCQYEAWNIREKIATCVTVKTKELGTFTGRTVYSTGSVIVLYVPAPESPPKVVRIPLAEAVIEARRSGGH